MKRRRALAESQKTGMKSQAQICKGLDLNMTRHRAEVKRRTAYEQGQLPYRTATLKWRGGLS